MESSEPQVEPNDSPTVRNNRIKERFQLQFGNRGLNQAAESANSIWQNLLDDCETDADEKMITEIMFRNKENIAKPVYNESVQIVETGEQFWVNLLWRDKKVMLFREDSEEDFKIASKTREGLCYSTKGEFDVDEFLQSIESFLYTLN